MRARADAGAGGCEARLRAAGGSVGPGGAAASEPRAVMSVAARLAAAGTSCVKAGGLHCKPHWPVSASRRREAAAEEEQGEGCQIREPDFFPFPWQSLPLPRLLA